jgi:type III secretory pathway lipoprotein EscJ
MVQRLVAGSVPGLAADAVSVIEVAEPPAVAQGRTLTRIGPITVTRRSAWMLQTVLAAGLVVQIALALVLVTMLRRTRRTAKRA